MRTVWGLLAGGVGILMFRAALIACIVAAQAAKIGAFSDYSLRDDELFPELWILGQGVIVLAGLVWGGWLIRCAAEAWARRR